MLTFTARIYETAFLQGLVENKRLSGRHLDAKGSMDRILGSIPPGICSISRHLHSIPPGIISIWAAKRRNYAVAALQFCLAPVICETLCGNHATKSTTHGVAVELRYGVAVELRMPGSRKPLGFLLRSCINVHWRG